MGDPRGCIGRSCRSHLHTWFYFILKWLLLDEHSAKRLVRRDVERLVRDVERLVRDVERLVRDVERLICIFSD